jgi:microcystin-dependent protein
MAEPFIGEVRITSFNFAPRGWAFCNGQLLPINSNQALFSILGTTYGGDGRTNFALPDFQGRMAMHVGGSHSLGEFAGEAAHALSAAEMPAHTHAMQASSDFASATDPAGHVFAAKSRGGKDIYGPPASLTSLSAAALAPAGAGQAHNNLQPYLVLNFVIAIQGIFPSRN